jgi:aryl-alcohol dehydrogenase-like predicted oxidoreductase
VAITSPAPSSVHLEGVPVPLTRLVLGTMSFGDTADEAASAEIFEAAMAAGITGVDTANVYAKGITESLIAPHVRRYRDQIVLATKAGMPHPDAGDNPPLSPVALRASVEGSLRRLDVDIVDLFYLHQPDRETPIQATMDCVAELHAESKIRALGVSNYAAWQVADVAAAAERAGAPRPVVGQNVYNLLARRIEDEWLEFARTHDVLTMCYNPLAGGLLARVPDDDNEPTRFTGSVLAEMYRKRYWSPEVLTTVRRLAGIAEQSGLPLVELALRWLLSQEAVAVLLGGNRAEHVTSNIRTAEAGPLPKDILDLCDEATAPLKGAMPAYNR